MPRVSDLNEIFAVTTDDLLYVVDDPLGTSDGKKITVASFLGTAPLLTVDSGTLHVDVANNRVGINTLTPETAFHVNGTMTISDGGNKGVLAPTASGIAYTPDGGSAVNFLTDSDAATIAALFSFDVAPKIEDGLLFKKESVEPDGLANYGKMWVSSTGHLYVRNGTGISYQHGRLAAAETVAGQWAFANIDINGGAVDGTPVGASSASTGAFTSLTATSFASTGSGSATAITISSATPSLNFQETDAAATTTRWRWMPVAGALVLEAMNDANSVGTAAITVTRTGATADLVTIDVDLAVGTVIAGTWQGTAIDSNYIDQTLSVSTLDANTATFQRFSITTSAIIPDAPGVRDLGAAGNEFQQVYSDSATLGGLALTGAITQAMTWNTGADDGADKYQNYSESTVASSADITVNNTKHYDQYRVSNFTPTHDTTKVLYFAEGVDFNFDGTSSFHRLRNVSRNSTFLSGSGGAMNSILTAQNTLRFSGNQTVATAASTLSAFYLSPTDGVGTLDVGTSIANAAAGVRVLLEVEPSAGNTVTSEWVSGMVVQGRHGGAGTSTLTNTSGVAIDEWGTFTATTTITNSYGYYLAAPSVAGTVTNAYGLYISDVTGATTSNYAIYTEGGEHFFGGPIGQGNVYTGPTTGGHYFLHNEDDSTSGGSTAVKLQIKKTEPSTGTLRVVHVAASGKHTTGTQAAAVSYFATTRQDDAGTITDGVIFDGLAGTNHASATITNLYGLRLNTDNWTLGTVVNNYGIYVSAVSSATTANYAIYSEGGAVELSDGTVTTTGAVSTGALTFTTGTVSGKITSSVAGLFLDNTQTGAYLRSGNANVGSHITGLSAFATFSHQSLGATAGTYAMIQSSSGATYVNSASGQLLRFQVGGVQVASFSDVLFSAGATTLTGALTGTTATMTGAVSTGALTVTHTGASTSAAVISGDTARKAVLNIRNTSSADTTGYSWVAGQIGTGNDGFSLYDEDSAATRLVVSSAGAFDFQGNAVSTGALTSTGLTVGTTTALDTTAEVYREFTETSGSYYYTQYNFGDVNPAANSAAYFMGTRPSVEVKSGNTYDIGWLWATAPRVFHWGTGTVTEVRAVNPTARNRSTGTITSATGVWSTLKNDNVAGTITTGRAGYFDVVNSGVMVSAYGIQTSFSAVGTMTNAYGLYIGDVTAATNNYAIYVEGGALYYGGVLVPSVDDGVEIQQGHTVTTISPSLAISTNTKDVSAHYFETTLDSAYDFSKGRAFGVRTIVHLEEPRSVLRIHATDSGVVSSGNETTAAAMAVGVNSSISGEFPQGLTYARSVVAGAAIFPAVAQTNSFTEITGIHGFVWPKPFTGGSTTVTTLQGGYIMSRADASLGTLTVTNQYGVQVETTYIGSPVVTNAYGIYVHDVTHATSNYAIYSEGGAVELTDGTVTTTGAVSTGALTSTTGTFSDAITQAQTWAISGNDGTPVSDSDYDYTITSGGAITTTTTEHYAHRFVSDLTLTSSSTKLDFSTLYAGVDLSEPQTAQRVAAVMADVYGGSSATTYVNNLVGVRSWLTPNLNTSYNHVRSVESTVELTPDDGTSTVTATDIKGYHSAVVAKPPAGNTVTITKASGYEANFNVSALGGTTNTTEQRGFYQRNWGAATDTVVTSAYGFYTTVPLSSGTTTNLYGVYVSDVTGTATNNYAIYVEGGESYFGDKITQTTSWNTGADDATEKYHNHSVHTISSDGIINVNKTDHVGTLVEFNASGAHDVSFADLTPELSRTTLSGANDFRHIYARQIVLQDTSSGGGNASVMKGLQVDLLLTGAGDRGTTRNIVSTVIFAPQDGVGTYSQGASYGIQASVYSDPVVGNTINGSGLFGFRADVYATGAGAATQSIAYAYDANSWGTKSATASVGTAAAFRAASPSVTGTVTSAYGLYLGDVTGATNNYAIYVEGGKSQYNHTTTFSGSGLGSTSGDIPGLGAEFSQTLTYTAANTAVWEQLSAVSKNLTINDDAAHLAYASTVFGDNTKVTIDVTAGTQVSAYAHSSQVYTGDVLPAGNGGASYAYVRMEPSGTNTTSSGSWTAVNADVIVAPTAAGGTGSVTSLVGMTSRAALFTDSDATGAVTALNFQNAGLTGFRAVAYPHNTATAVDAVGVMSFAGALSTGTLSGSAYNFFSAGGYFGAPTGTQVSKFGFYHEALGGGTATNEYGLYIEEPTQATNNYAVYVEGGDYYFGTGSRDENSPGTAITYDFDYDYSVSTAGTVNGIYIDADVAAGSADRTGTHVNLNLSFWNNGTANVMSEVRGLSTAVMNKSTGTITTAEGARLTARNDSTGTVTNLIAAKGYYGGTTAGGTITSAYGFYSDPYDFDATTTNLYQFYAGAIGGSSPVVTNAYGLYVVDVTAGTNNYAIYVEGGESYFGGEITQTDSYGAGADDNVDVVANTRTLTMTSSADITVSLKEAILNDRAYALDSTHNLSNVDTLSERSLTVIGASSGNLRQVRGSYVETQVVNGYAGDLNYIVGSDSRARHYGNGTAAQVEGLAANALAVPGDGAGTQTTTLLHGAFIQAKVSPSSGNTANVATVIGTKLWARIQNSGTSAVTDLRGLWVDSWGSTVATGTATNASAVYLTTPATTGAVTNAYGLYVEDVTGGTNNWAIYVEGGDSYFGGAASFERDGQVYGDNWTIYGAWDFRTNHHAVTTVDGQNAFASGSWLVATPAAATANNTTGGIFGSAEGTGAYLAKTYLYGGVFFATTDSVLATSATQASIGLYSFARNESLTGTNPRTVGIEAYGYAATGTTTTDLTGADIFVGPAGTVTTVRAVRAKAVAVDGAITTLAYFDTLVDSGALGTITDLYGMRLTAETSGSLTVTNAYGLYVEEQTVATNNYAIYVEGGESYFGGPIGQGSLYTDPSAGGYYYLHTDDDSATGNVIPFKIYVTKSVASTGKLRAQNTTTMGTHASGTQAELVNYYASGRQNAAGTVTDMVLFDGVAGPSAASGLITNLYGLRLDTGWETTGTVTNNYGIYVSDVSNATTNNYAIYVEGGESYFGGEVLLTADGNLAGFNTTNYGLGTNRSIHSELEASDTSGVGRGGSFFVEGNPASAPGWVGFEGVGGFAEGLGANLAELTLIQGGQFGASVSGSSSPWGMYGVHGNATAYASAGTTQLAVGGLFNVYLKTSSTLDAKGIEVLSSMDSGATATNLYGIHVKSNKLDGTATNFYGVKIGKDAGALATITNAYSLYVEAPYSSSGDNYAIYVEGGYSYLGGRTTVERSLSYTGGLQPDFEGNIVNSSNTLATSTTFTVAGAVSATWDYPSINAYYVNVTDDGVRDASKAVLAAHRTVIDTSLTAGTQLSSIYGDVLITNATEEIGTISGRWTQVNYEGTAAGDSVTLLEGYYAQASSAQTGGGLTVGEIRGGYFQGYVAGSVASTATNVSGIRIGQCGAGPSTATVTNTYAIWAASPYSGGTTTNAYGLYIGDVTGATNNYAIYVEGGESYFGDTISIQPSTTPALSWYSIFSVYDVGQPLQIRSVNNADGGLGGANVGAFISVEGTTSGNTNWTDHFGVVAAAEASGANLSKTTQTGGAFYGYFDTGASGTKNGLFGIQGNAVDKGSGTLSYLYGGYFSGKMSGTATVTNFHGAMSLISFVSGSTATSASHYTAQQFATDGTITSLYDLRTIRDSGATATITNAYGVYYANYPSGTITNEYGLYIEEPTQATNNYAIYVEGGESYFGGKLTSSDGVTLTGKVQSFGLPADAIKLQRRFTAGSGVTVGIRAIFESTLASITNYGLYIGSNVEAASATAWGMNARGDSTGTANINGSYGITGYGNHYSTGTATTVTGVVGQGLQDASAGAVTTVTGVRAAATVSGTTTNQYGVHASTDLAGTSTNAYSLYVTTPTGAGSATTYAGLYIESPAIATNQYAIYVEGGDVHLAGSSRLNIGTGTFSANTMLKTYDTYSATSGNVIPTQFWLIQDTASTGLLRASESIMITTHTTGTMADQVGFYVASYTLGGGVVTDMYGVRTITGRVTAGTVTNTYGYYFDTDWINSSVTNAYGLYIEDVASAATNNYAIYTEGGEVWFGGGPVTVSTSSSGATPNASFDDFVIEAATNVGFSMLTADTSVARFTMGNPSDNVGMQMSWDYTNDRLAFGTSKTAGYVDFLVANGSVAMTLTAAKSVVIGTAALGTTATDGFLYVPTCAGAPTGTPTTQTGTVALVFDTTNNDLYLYDASWIKVAMA